MTDQNRSTAIMSRRVEPRDSLDDFPTPPWATRALCEWLLRRGFDLDGMVCREPAANRGYMVRPLREYFGEVIASDIHDYGLGFPVSNYLSAAPITMVGWTITNPPFRLAERFIKRALATSAMGVAILTRTAFLEGAGRYERLFSVQPPTHVLQFVERVPMLRGRVDGKGSTATAYCWLVWLKTLRPDHGTQLEWLAPCRKRLEKESDYD